MSKNIYIVEGQCEKYFLTEMKSRLKIKGIGKKNIIIHNCSSSLIPIKVRKEKYENVYIILDADLNKEFNFENIKNSIGKINATKIHLLIQDLDFEDELIYAMEDIKSLKDLCNFVGCKSTSKKEFKTKFLDITNLENKFATLNLKKLYTRGDNYKEDLKKYII